MSVSPSTVLKLAPGVAVQYRSGIDVEISLGAERVLAGPHGVAILEAFRTATPMGKALELLGSRTAGMQEWIELTATITTFAKIGILRPPTDAPPTLNPDWRRFDAAYGHVRMLDDRTRTARYQAAIRAVVRPGDVVVELGTGTGVLSVTAAQAGAARVYAIEASSIADAARRVFAENSVVDRVTLVEGISSRVTLPERCDVLISELIGRDPLEEEVLEFTRDAVTRFLKPGGRLVPSTLEMFAMPVTLPSDVRRHWTFTNEAVAEWRNAYGIDFSSLPESSSRSWWKMTVSQRRLAAFPMLTEPLSLLRRDLAQVGEVAFSATARGRATASGEVGAVALFFGLSLAPGIDLDTDPRFPRPDNSWDHLVWGMPTPLAVREGDEIEVTLRYREDGPPIELRLLSR
jgi:type I protein arginine methyltransferase